MIDTQVFHSDGINKSKKTHTKAVQVLKASLTLKLRLAG
jgi:hypothetical protein